MSKTLRGSYEVMCEKWVAIFFMLPMEKEKKHHPEVSCLESFFFIKRSEIPSFKYISVEFLQGRVSNEVSTTFSYYINTLKSVLTAFFFFFALQPWKFLYMQR